VTVFRFIEVEKASYPIAVLCRVLGVSVSGYHAWRGRPQSPRRQHDNALCAWIAHIHRDSRRTYGAPRVHAELRADGARVGRKRVARLMRELGLEGAYRRKYRRITIADATQPPAPDLVRRDFRATRRDQLWVADITYVRTWQGWLYVALVIDTYSRRVVGWSMRDDLQAELVVDALEMAVWRRQPTAGLVHHSDRGSQYTSWAIGRTLRDSGILQSMGSRGDAYDNAQAESFMSTLKTELVDRRSWPTRDAARRAIFDYIEGWYNPRRRHSALDYHSPIEYENITTPEAANAA
jgi:putative transposase